MTNSSNGEGPSRYSVRGESLHAAALKRMRATLERSLALDSEANIRLYIATETHLDSEHCHTKEGFNDLVQMYWSAGTGYGSTLAASLVAQFSDDEYRMACEYHNVEESWSYPFGVDVVQWIGLYCREGHQNTVRDFTARCCTVEGIAVEYMKELGCVPPVWSAYDIGWYYRLRWLARLYKTESIIRFGHTYYPHREGPCEEVEAYNADVMEIETPTRRPLQSGVYTCHLGEEARVASIEGIDLLLNLPPSEGKWAMSVPPGDNGWSNGHSRARAGSRKPERSDVRKPNADPQSFSSNLTWPDCVTLRQAASIVHKSKATLRRLIRAGLFPDPLVEGGGGKTALYNWPTIRPILEEEFGIPLPAVFPANHNS